MLFTSYVRLHLMIVFLVSFLIKLSSGNYWEIAAHSACDVLFI